jgi:hypothetical protein
MADESVELTFENIIQHVVSPADYALGEPERCI